MRIAIGGILHETSTLVPKLTTLKDFENGLGIYRGQAIFERFRGTNICTCGFIDGAAEHGFEAVPLLWAFPYPSGLIARDVYESLKAEFHDRLRKANAEKRIDGVLLDQHGSMVIDGIDDGDGDFIESVRNAVGPDRPVVVNTDLHSNHTQRRVAAANAIIGYDTYPHVDMAERGREAAGLIARTLERKARPTMALRQLPLFWGTPTQVTAHPPMDEVLRRMHDLEKRPGVLTVTVATAFPWADVPDAGCSVIAVADGNPALARKTADELGDWIWQNRELWYAPPLSVKEGLDRAEKLGKYPIILADQADNTGGGAPGDSTEVLKTFLERSLQGAVILYLVDNPAAIQARQLGVGGTARFSLGGRSHPLQGTPVEADAEVVAVSDGAFRYDGPMYGGLTGNMGPSAWLRIGGVNVVVVTKREQPLDPGFARTLGIDCPKMRYIAVKSSAHFRSGFERFAGSIWNVDASAIHMHDFTKLPRKKRNKDVFPVEIPPKSR